MQFRMCASIYSMINIPWLWSMPGGSIFSLGLASFGDCSGTARRVVAPGFAPVGLRAGWLQRGRAGTVGMGFSLCKRCDMASCVHRGTAGGELHLGVGFDGRIRGLLPAEPWLCASSERALGYLT